MQSYHFPTLCFNFQFFSQPPCCFATSPLTKGGKKKRTLLFFPYKGRQAPQTTTHYSSSLRRPKACGNPQTTIFLFIHRKEKEFTTFCPICHCEGRRPVAIHKPQNHHKKTEKKKKSLLFNKPKNYFSIFTFQFLSQPPCCFATSPLTKGGKPSQITTHCSSSLRGVKRRSNPQPLITNTKTEKKKNSMNE